MKTITLTAIILIAASVCYAVPPKITIDPNTIKVYASDPNYVLVTCVIPIPKQAIKARNVLGYSAHQMFNYHRLHNGFMRLIKQAEQYYIRNKTLEELEAKLDQE